MKCGLNSPQRELLFNVTHEELVARLEAWKQAKDDARQLVESFGHNKGWGELTSTEKSELIEARRRVRELERLAVNSYALVRRDTKRSIFRTLKSATRSNRSRNPSVQDCRTPLSTLIVLTDLVPSRALRKKQKKLLADESAEIFVLLEQGRHSAAQWRTVWAWIHWVRYLVTSPISIALKAVKRFSIY